MKSIFEYLKQFKKIILFEPNYNRKFEPIGLGKIATYLKSKNIPFEYQREYKNIGEDLVCMTTLFTYDSKWIIYNINKIKTPILLGGVFAGLQAEFIKRNFPQVELFEGYSKELDMLPVDYSLKYDEHYPEMAQIFTSRGCYKKCKYCAVKTLEKDFWIVPNWKELIGKIKRETISILDNNLFQNEQHGINVCNFFRSNKKQVMFHGIDVKNIIIDAFKDVNLKQYGLHIAFDRMADDKLFQNVVEELKKVVKEKVITVYILFNFMDSPKEAIYRMSECIKLGIRPYPQQFTPLDSLNKSIKYISPKWTDNLCRAFRHYGLMEGYNRKMSFYDFIKFRWKLSVEDYEKLNKD